MITIILNAFYVILSAIKRTNNLNFGNSQHEFSYHCFVPFRNCKYFVVKLLGKALAKFIPGFRSASAYAVRSSPDQETVGVL